jgi:polyphosphate kinase
MMEKRVISVHRELSWLQFNERVLQEAADSRNPLISRVHFLGIFSSNLDEFFKVRIASLRRELKILRRRNSSLLEMKKPLQVIHERVIELQWEFDQVFEQTKKDLSKQGIHFKNERQLTANQREFLVQFFDQEIRQDIIPILVGPKLPMSELEDNALYLIVELELKESGKYIYALIEVPPSKSRWVILPADKQQYHVIFLEDVIRLNLKKIFSPFGVKNARAFDLKVVRDAEYEVENDFSKSVFDKISKSIKQRSKGDYVRINFDHETPEDLMQWLISKTKVRDIENIIPGGRYHNKRDLLAFPNFDRPEWVFPQTSGLIHPAFGKEQNILDTFLKGDVLLQFPYQKFSHLLDMLRSAAIDPSVRTIRISMYRIAKDSHILHALINAAKNGKRVVVIIEVQARFDEEHNLEITKMLQDEGIKVIPGIPGLKVHCKIFQITRKLNGKNVRITHIGTGNFHEKTARVYADFSLITTHNAIGKEVRNLFDFFEKNYLRPQFRHLMVSPFNSRRKLIEAIQGEINNVRSGKRGLIIIKVNNVLDEVLIKKLQEAAEEGVQVNLIVRGVCLLVPSSKKQKENIRMISILGRYLEHARVFAFGVGQSRKIWLGSADWMIRNLDYRIEVMVPVLDSQIKQTIIEWLNLQLNNKARARNLFPEQINEFIYPSSSPDCMDIQKEWRDQLENSVIKNKLQKK